MALSLDEAVDLTRTGDIWIFRGQSAFDRAIRLTTNSPVNHVGMVVVLDDLPPLLWHAELGRSLPDMWTGKHQRGAQLHVLRDAVTVWATKYGQRAWLRQLEHEISRDMEDAVLRTIARLDGTPFPPMTRLASRWLLGRIPLPRRRRGGGGGGDLETAFCAEIVALTYQEMGLLDRKRGPSRYDPGNFWSGDDLGLTYDTKLGGEIEITP